MLVSHFSSILSTENGHTRRLHQKTKHIASDKNLCHPRHPYYRALLPLNHANDSAQLHVYASREQRGRHEQQRALHHVRTESPVR